MSNTEMSTNNTEETVTGKIVRFLSPMPGDEEFDKPGKKTFIFKEKGSTLITVHGYFPPIRSGDSYSLCGKYENTEGRLVFEVSSAKKHEAQEKEAYSDVKFLVEKIAGLGYKSSEAIVAALGENAVEQLQKDPELVYGVPNLSDAKKMSVLVFFGQASKEFVDTFKFLQGFCGFWRNTSWEIWKKYHGAAEKQIRDDPYILLREIDRLHFGDVDPIGMKLGIKKDDPRRLHAAIMYILVRAIFSPEEGHSFLTFSELRTRAISILDANFVSGRKVNAEIKKMCEDQDLFRELIPGTNQEAIYTQKEYLAEVKIAQRIRVMVNERTPELLSFAKYIPSDLDEDQNAAVCAALEYNLCLIYGAAGTGKTSMLTALLDTFKAAGYDLDTESRLCAFTGKAAKRIEEATGRKASTIHACLSWSGAIGGFIHGAENPLPEKIFIVDESSMLTNTLFSALIEAIPEGSKVIIIGDTHQLPPIGGGNLLRELRRCKKIQCSKLRVVHRQEGEKNAIIEAAHAVLDGKMPQDSENFKIMYVPNDRAGAELFIKTMQTADIQTTIGLSPLRKYNIGVDHLNNMIQEKANPQSPGKEELKIGLKMRFRTGDPVIHTKNNYEMGLMNGAMGTVISCSEEDKTVTVEYKDALTGTRQVVYDYDLCRFQLDLCYATTAYKAQGSEREIAVIYIPQGAYSLNTRNSLYTMITRAKRRVILIGMESAIADCIKNDAPTIRNTMLAHRINPDVLPGNVRDPEVDND